MEPTFPHIKNILFTTDLSRQTSHAFNYAVGLASRYEARLTILFVIEDNPQVHSQDFRDFLGENRWAEIRHSLEDEVRQQLIGKKREAAEIRQVFGEMLSTARGKSPGQAIDSDRIVVTHGVVADCIVKEIQENQIDLLVMGYHRRGRLAEAISGSVSRSVLRKVEVPVLLVKLPEND
jgi:nucleotide-binding universal stress UspA family protein